LSLASHLATSLFLVGCQNSLHLACKNGTHEIVTLLLARDDVDITLKDERVRTEQISYRDR